MWFFGGVICRTWAGGRPFKQSKRSGFFQAQKKIAVQVAKSKLLKIEPSKVHCTTITWNMEEIITLDDHDDLTQSQEPSGGSGSFS